MNRFVRLGSIAMGVAGALVAIAWLVKDRMAGPTPAPEEPDEAPRFRVTPPPQPPVPEPEAEPDDLSEIRGIGPVYQARLAEAGITTFIALAGSEATRLAEEIEAPVSQVQSWIDAARRRG